MTLPAGTYAPWSITFRDATDEIGNMGAFASVLTAANFDSKRADFTAFVTAVDGITIGQIVKHAYGIETVVNPIAIPTSAAAQRENKLLVRYYDALTFERMTLTVPTVNLANLVFNTDAKDFVSMEQWVGGGTNMETFVAAFTSFVKNPRTGNNVVVQSLQYVGRNA